MGKTWHFINPETKVKRQSLVTARGHKENPKKKQVASRKALSL